MLLNVVDLEATCWRGSPPEGQSSEIIEIGLTVVDLEARTRVSRHGIMVRPRTSTVSDFCTELTSLTQPDVDSGIDFAEACAALVDEHDSGTRPWASWGDYDRNQFRRQCKATGTSYPFGEHHTNAKKAFAAAFGLPKPTGMDGALEVAGLPLEGRHHRGEDDAWNIAALILLMVERGSWT
ncbi:3'-5' exonuclease [Pseudonocardia spinosispora]|uniref:3'-5' exonuclease n=1 Tax=Pseudonocardia spinosispora TaxID=103441 RepID=UPI000424FFD6|nr:3'-5' exonuclease [Pseudonocardia spinosispora]